MRQELNQTLVRWEIAPQTVPMISATNTSFADKRQLVIGTSVIRREKSPLYGMARKDRNQIVG
jgi:hypothetical protein